ncbi:MAG: hypothetical protein HY909_02830 [Deltaproteobacteria bacterium]|nr:hypothetical protein [Deltaproteobacteria bacterium]
MMRLYCPGAFLASLALQTVDAPGRCRVVPGEDGAVAVWAISGGAARSRPPSDLALRLDASLRLPPGLDPAAAALPAGWRPSASSHSYLDLGASLGGRGPRSARAALVLETQRPGRRYLFVGSDDALAVTLDGRELARNVRPRASRDDDDVVPLELTAGRHLLVLHLASRGDLDLFARIVGEDFAPDPTLRLELPGVPDDACEALGTASAAIEVRRTAESLGTTATVTLSYPGGTAAAGVPRRVSLAAPALPPVTASVGLGGPFMAPTTLTLTVPAATRAVSLEGIGAPRAFPVVLEADTRAVLLRAARVLAGRDPTATDPAGPLPQVPPAGPIPWGSLWSVERAEERLRALVSEGDRDLAFVRAETALLRSLLDDLEAGRDPYEARRGPLRRAYRSPLDGSLQEYSVYVPASYQPSQASPVVVGLHGLRGSAHRMLPVLFGLYDETEGRTHAERHLPPLPDARAILVAPDAYGDSFYRHAGEHDVLRVLEEVRAAYRTDPDRTYMTGLSMGGIGAASVPFHFPSLFAAAAPLCGYHSYLIRSDTRGVRRPWELFLMEYRSNASWAENGLHLPLYIVQGTLDQPLANSTVLSERYTQLGYALETEWPALPHNVWSQTYAGGRIIPRFLRYRRDPAPRRVRFRTPDLRWRRAYWVTFEALEAPGRWGELDLDLDRQGRGRGRSAGLSAVTVTPPAAAFAPGVSAVQVTLDGDALTAPVGQATTWVRSGGRWAPGAAPPQRGHGPLREALDGPAVFVYGTQVAAETALNQRVARHWARRPGMALRYPVVSDVQATDAVLRGRTVVLVGTPGSNALLGRWQPSLPVRVQGDAIVVGARNHPGAHQGVVFATAVPSEPERTLVVVTGTDALAVARSRSLPELLPDFVVYDDRVAPARGRVLLGEAARVVAAGFLDGASAVHGYTRDTLP